jgi:hypothetical protein
MVVTVISISSIDTKCEMHFDGSNFITNKDEDLKKLRFKNGDIIPNIEDYFTERY